MGKNTSILIQHWLIIFEKQYQDIRRHNFTHDNQHFQGYTHMSRTNISLTLCEIVLIACWCIRNILIVWATKVAMLFNGDPVLFCLHLIRIDCVPTTTSRHWYRHKPNLIIWWMLNSECLCFHFRYVTTFFTIPLYNPLTMYEDNICTNMNKFKSSRQNIRAMPFVVVSYQIVLYNIGTTSWSVWHPFRMTNHQKVHDDVTLMKLQVFGLILGLVYSSQHAYVKTTSLRDICE